MLHSALAESILSGFQAQHVNGMAVTRERKSLSQHPIEFVMVLQSMNKS